MATVGVRDGEVAMISCVHLDFCTCVHLHFSYVYVVFLFKGLPITIPITVLCSFFYLLKNELTANIY